METILKTQQHTIEETNQSYFASFVCCNNNSTKLITYVYNDIQLSFPYFSLEEYKILLVGKWYN
jgi:hypothetical protein